MLLNAVGVLGNKQRCCLAAAHYCGVIARALLSTRLAIQARAAAPARVGTACVVWLLWRPQRLQLTLASISGEHLVGGPTQSLCATLLVGETLSARTVSPCLVRGPGDAARASRPSPGDRALLSSIAPPRPLGVHICTFESLFSSSFIASSIITCTQQARRRTRRSLAKMPRVGLMLLLVLAAYSHAAWAARVEPIAEHVMMEGAGELLQRLKVREGGAAFLVDTLRAALCCATCAQRCFALLLHATFKHTSTHPTSSPQGSAGDRNEPSRSLPVVLW